MAADTSVCVCVRVVCVCVCVPAGCVSIIMHLGISLWYLCGVGLCFFSPAVLVMGKLPVISGGPRPGINPGWLESGGRLATRGIIQYEHASYDL
jgi:hypothetical protein